MALFKVMTKAANSPMAFFLIEPDMSVEVASVSAITPMTANGGQTVTDALLRVYGRSI